MQLALALRLPCFSVVTTVPASLEPASGTAPSILLVEEYDALAAALTSALRKFAPQYRTIVVPSINDAESAAAKVQPRLFILDLDPPPSKAIEFLDRMRAAHPDARVLVIATGGSSQLTMERSGKNAVQFVEKPFELAELGAAVQALLGSWTDPSSGDSRGTLRDLNLRDQLPLACMSGATTMLKVSSPMEETGEVHLSQGQIHHATARGLSGVEALKEMMRWKNAQGKEAQAATNARRTIHGPWLSVFMEAVRSASLTAEQTSGEAPSVSAPPELPKAKTGKKIVVIDDTEMLLIFVEDSLLMADPTLEIVTALSGSEGIKQIETVMPDLVLLDYSIPDLRGDQICERLLENKTTARIPVVMMSGHVLEMMATAERYLNVVATVAKPFMSETLVQLISEVLAKGPSLPISSKEAALVKKRTAAPIATGSPEVKPVGHRKASKVKPSQLTPEPASAPTEQPTPQPEKVTASAPTLATAPTIAGSNGATVVVGWGMELTSVEITPRFRIGTVHAKPFARTFSVARLHPTVASESGLGAGFELAKVDLDANGQISMMRVRPTRAPADSIHIQNGLAITDVKVTNEPTCIQFTGRSSAPMVMQLVARFKVVGVQLSDRFEVAQLILQPEGRQVQITLDPQLIGNKGAVFETLRVDLEGPNRITDFVLNPVR